MTLKNLRALIVFTFCLLPFACFAGQPVNVNYVHLLIDHVHGIQVPIKASNIYQAVNVKYVLCAVDRANEILNGAPTTDYCNHELAVLQIIDDIATIDAVTRLIKINLWPGTGGEGEAFKVHLTGMTAGDLFDFQISAQGNFTINWGDGSATQSIPKGNTMNTTFGKTYAAAGNYIVTIGGRATGYNPGFTNPAVSFMNSANKANITRISGDMGSVFPILGSAGTGTPRFRSTFAGLTGLTSSIPANLFAGLHGAPLSYMFENTFANSNFSGSIPESLFVGIGGAPLEAVFSGTFSGCVDLEGEIPGNLFAGINGAPAMGLFAGTFSGCVGLIGVIPGNLFAGISGAPNQRMFADTFNGCTGLIGIGDGLFDGITGTEINQMFNGTFNGCTNLAGPSAMSNGQHLYQKWPSATGGWLGEVTNCYNGATKLSDWASIPAAWK